MTAALHTPPLTGAALSQARQSWTLVARVQAGQREAFGEIYDRYAGKVYAYIHRRVEHRQTAEDLTADTFFRALDRIDTFTWQGRDFGAVLIRIAHHATMDHLRSARHRLERSYSLNPALTLEFEPAAGDDTAAEALGHLADVDLLAAVCRLPDTLRDVLVLRFLRGLTVRETADALGVGISAVKMRQRRAVDALSVALPDGFVR